MATFIFPTTGQLRAIEQEVLPRLMADRPIFDILPVETVDDYLLVWEQLDNFIGLQQVRGLDGALPRVIKVGARRFQMEPGVYGEFIDLNETELTRRRQLGQWPNNGVDVRDLVRASQDQLLQRRLDRIEFIGWTLLATGTFSIAGPNGAVLHTDTYTTQTASAAVAWATVATATPLADFRAVQLLGPAKGANFGAGAVAYLNRTTFNKMVSNTNASDLAGRFTVLMNTVRSPESINRIAAGEDLPAIQVYDGGYFTDAGTFTRFIANDKVIIVGQRPGGRRVGAYRYVRNVNNPGMAPGPYTEVIPQPNPPKRIDVFDGHNGGPVIEYPGSIAVLTVS